MNDPELPIFLDPTRHRYALFKWTATLVTVMAVAWLAIFSLSLYYVEKLPAPSLPDDEAAALPSVPPREGDPCTFANGGTRPGGTGGPRLYAYLPVDPEWAGASFGRDCGAIDVLMPERYALALPSTDLATLEPELEQDEALRRNRQRPDGGAQILPVLTLSWYDPDAARRTAFGDSRAVRQLADRIVQRVRRDGHSGLCLHPMSAVDTDAGFVALLAEVADRLSAAGMKTCLAVAADSPLWRDGRVAAAVDLVVVLAFQEPSRGMPPQALAPQDWFERLAAEATQRIGRERLVIALGAFGYDWVSGDARPRPIGYAEAMRLAARHRGQVDLSPGTLNTAVRLVDARGQRHDIRLLDAVSAFNQRMVLDRLRPAGIAVWSLGLDDPGVWAAIGARPQDVPQLLRTVALTDYVGYEGMGPLFRVLEKSAAGDRRLKRDADTGLVTAQAYETIPRPYTMQRLGAADHATVVLSFDDGPDAEYTPLVLDVLRQKGVPAVFFLVGRNIIHIPDVVRDMVADGHEIGSHTFFHPDITNVSDIRRHIELSALQRLIVSVTGHSTTLFRSPYGRGFGPLTAAQARPFDAIAKEGYAILGSTVVPPDWATRDPDRIVASALEQMLPSGGNVIVLHDGGGDRRATVAALPALVDALRERGYRFASVADLLGVDRAALMPREGGPRALLDNWSFRLISLLGALLKGAFWLAVGLGALRSLAILILALARRHYPVATGDHTPSVTVVIPAYNEAEVILGCIASVLRSDYPHLNVVVVDDGSTDGTAEKVRAGYGDDPRVMLIGERNQGKWKALDTAYTQVDTEIVVAVDADSLLMPDAIRKLVRAFRDPAVGAVAGKVAIGNAHSLLTRLQALEYITAQNIDRRAAEVFNGMLVVPGAIGAWRTEAVRKAGLYVNQTVTEDADLTVALLRAGYRVVFENEAVSVTEAPETLRNFMRQRLRWSFGMMQTAWKHRRAARERRAVGWISIPDLWLFGVGLSLLAPLADLVFLGSLIDLATDLSAGASLPTARMSVILIASYLALPLLDTVLALIAFAFERRAPWLVLLLPFQRLFYRPLLYVTVYRAVWRALTGRLAGWGKFRRLGALRTPDS